MANIADLEAEYLRLQGMAATEQSRFAFSARPNFATIAEAGRKANEARRQWLDAKRIARGDRTDGEHGQR